MNKRDTPIGELHKAEIAKLRRKVSELEKQLLPRQIAVYKAAMRHCESRIPLELTYTTSFNRLIRACRKARGGK